MVFSDGSGNPYLVVAYAGWLTKDRTYEARIIASKNRIAPVTWLLTLCALSWVALLLASDWEFSHRLRPDTVSLLFITLYTAKIVKTMISKESYRFNTYAAKQIKVIQDKSSGVVLGSRKLEHCTLGNLKEKPHRTRTTWCIAERPRLFQAVSRGVASIKPCQCRRATRAPQSSHEC